MVDKSEFSRIRASAEILKSAKKIIYNPSISEIYNLAEKGINTIITDVPIPKVAVEKLGLSADQNRVIVSYTGQDVGRSAWARRVLQDFDPDTQDKFERIVREVNAKLLSRKLLYTEVYIGKSEYFMIKASLILPVEWAKLALDFQANFIPVNEQTTEVYKKRKIKAPEIKIVIFPEWEPTMVRGQDNKPILPELPRLTMLFDREYNTAYLLGARYFGELKKAALTLTWKTIVMNGHGAAIHGSSKYMKVKKGDKLERVVFITIGLSGTGKSTIGLSSHEGYLDPEKGECVRIANDDALAVLFDYPVTLGFEEGCFNKTDSYTPDNYMVNTMVTAENVLVYQDENGRRLILHEDTYSPNGRCVTYRQALKGASEDVNVPWPNYITLIMRDETLPPMSLVEDPILAAALFMSLSTKPSGAENIPLEEMKKLKIVPGANPFIIYPLTLEAKTVSKMISVTGAKCLVFNTGDFFVDANERVDIPPSVTLSFYPKVAREEIEWEEYRPGLKIPKFDNEYSQKYDPRNVKDKKTYRELFNGRIQTRIDFLKNIGLEQKFIDALEALKLPEDF